MPQNDNGFYKFDSEGWTDVEKLINSKDNIDNFRDGLYHCWRYIPENTIPSVAKMKHGVTTGVAFKVLLLSENSRPQIDDPYKAATLEDLKDEDIWGKYIDINEETGKITLTFNGKSAEVEEVKQADLVSKNEVSSGFDYQEQEGYYLTYYYWIRHNHAHTYNTNEITDPMEFGVVRNNVYKLQVIKFSGVPIPFNPETPDEEGTPDPEPLEVNVRINPWWYYQIKLDW